MADQSSKTSSDPNTAETARLQTQDEQRKFAELESIVGVRYTKEIADLRRKGGIEEHAFQEIYETLKNPNLMAKNSYNHFMKCIAKGKFPNNAKHSTRFLRALKGGDEERTYAENILKHLSDDAQGELTPRMEKVYLKHLNELREKDLAQQTITSTSSATKAITESSDLHSRIENITQTKTEKWVLERAPEELINKLESLETKQFELAKKSNSLDKKLHELLDRNADQAEVAAIKTQIVQLDKEIEELSKEMEVLNQEELDYYTRTLSRYRALEYFSMRAGFNINNTEDLKIWFFDIASGKKDTKAKTIQKAGLETDPETGQTKKVMKEIKISRLFFEREKEDTEPYSPGELWVEYYNDEGKLDQSSYKNFMHLIDAFEAYEDINTLAELNEEIAHENGYQDLQVGQEFKTKVYLGDDPQGNKLYEEVAFKIENIDEASGQIILDKSVTKVPKEWISSSVHPALYFDRKQQKFAYGEFAKLIRQHGYNRELSLEELQNALGKQNVKQTKDALALMHGQKPELVDRFKRIGGVPTNQLTIPKPGEVTKVYYLDTEGNRQPGLMKREVNSAGKEELVIEPDPSVKTNEYLDDMVVAGVPLHMATKRAGLNTVRPGTPMWSKRRRALCARAAMDDAKKGSIIDRSDASESDKSPVDEIITQEKADQKSAIEAAEAGPSEPSGTKPKAFSEEMLAYDKVNKIGGTTVPEESLLKSLWTNTRFLSGSDIWEMGKVMWEYYERRFQRRQKDRYSSVGKDLYFFAPEMKRINQAAETEQMNQFKEAFDQKGVFEIRDTLESTDNRDEMKACFATLAEKGQIRWDSIDTWKNLNNFCSPGLAIPIPANGDPATQQSPTDPRTGQDFLKACIDSMWGEGQYNDWYSANKSKAQSNARGYYEEGKELESTDGGHAQRLGELLHQHKQRAYVDPHEYEGLILHAIENGKSSMQAKIYYMVEGVAARNKDGRTILAPDRIGHINSEMLPRFPILEYMTGRFKREGSDKPKRPTIDDYNNWCNIFDEGDPSNPDKYSPGAAVDRFMWKYVIPSDQTRTRINKALRNGENLDHDDMFAYLPPATEEVITDACKASAGSKKFLTIEGYANVFPGFSQYLRSVAESGKKERLVEGLRSYFKFESIMTNRYEKGKDKYQRMSDLTLNSKRGTVCTPGRPPAVFIRELNGLLTQIVEAYEDDDLSELFRASHEFVDENDRTGQDRIKKAIDSFGMKFQEVIKSDKGEKMLQITRAANLEGMPEGVSDKDKAERMRAFKGEDLE